MFENIENMIYNNVDFDDKFNNGDDDYFIINDVKGRGEYSENLSTIRVTGLDGVIIGGQQASEQYIEIHFTIKSPSYDSLHKKLESLLDTLYSEEDVPITFSDENGRTYFGRFREIVRSYEGSKIFKGIIYILRADPYKYGEEKTANFESDTVVVENQGTAPADPIFELEVNEPTTFAMVSNGDEYMMVGRPYNVEDDPPFQRYERIFYSDASSLTGWTTANAGEIDGTVAGSMETNGTRFQAENYGTGSGWHGPAIKTSLPEVLTDFRVETFVSFYNKNVAGYVGRVELYLLDELGNQVAKVAMKDTQNGQALSVGEARLGDTTVNHYMIDEPNRYWNNFFGILRIEREGSNWYAYFAMVDQNTGQHHTRRSVRWHDSENQFTRKVAQVVVHIGKFGNHQTTTGGVYSISVYKINQQQEGIPYIADTGDHIRFDHQTGDCFINGEPVPFDFGGDFFKLNKGFNTIAVQPENTFNTSLKYRERYR